jgi:hypothetical protein
VTNANPGGPTWVSIESYGQGDTASTIKNCDKDPAVLLTFLDGFIALEKMKARDVKSAMNFWRTKPRSKNSKTTSIALKMLKL